LEKSVSGDSLVGITIEEKWENCHPSENWIEITKSCSKIMSQTWLHIGKTKDQETKEMTEARKMRYENIMRIKNSAFSQINVNREIIMLMIASNKTREVQPRTNTYIVR
jgi:predicted SAM-dependent methyltransferase